MSFSPFHPVLLEGAKAPRASWVIGRCVYLQLSIGPYSWLRSVRNFPQGSTFGIDEKCNERIHSWILRLRKRCKRFENLKQLWNGKRIMGIVTSQSHFSGCAFTACSLSASSGSTSSGGETWLDWPIWPILVGMLPSWWAPGMPIADFHQSSHPFWWRYSVFLKGRLLGLSSGGTSDHVIKGFAVVAFRAAIQFFSR